MPLPEPAALGRHHALLTEFRRAFRIGLLEDGDAAPKLALEGTRLLEEAIRSGVRLEAVIFSRDGLERHGARLLPQLSRHVTTGVADDAAFRSVVAVEQPQGVAALAHWQPAALDAVFGPPDAVPLVLAAARLQDPGNLGTLIRAADAFGASGVVALQDTVAPFNPKAVRACAGSLFHLPVAARTAGDKLVAACRARGVKLVVAEAHGADAAHEHDWNLPTCLVVGQEGGGVPRELLRMADARVAIPMQRPVDSLNAGVAGAILLYEACRLRARS